jgi:hypothetical protein
MELPTPTKQKWIFSFESPIKFETLIGDRITMRLQLNCRHSSTTSRESFENQRFRSRIILWGLFVQMKKNLTPVLFTHSRPCHFHFIAGGLVPAKIQDAKKYVSNC